MSDRWPEPESRSLQEIAGDDWGDPSPEDTTLVTRVLNLRRKPVNLLEAEDLRILLGQHVNPEVLVPIAVKRLEENPLLEGDYYPGDVLVSVLRVDDSYWHEHPEQLARVKGVIAAVVSRICRAVELFADPAGKQMTDLREMGLEFDDTYGTASALAENWVLSRQCYEALRRFHKKLQNMIVQHPELWHESAVRSSHDWQEVRRLAAAALPYISSVTSAE